MIGKQVLAFGKSEKSEFINIRIFAASSGGRKGRRHIGRFTPDRERSHVCLSLMVPQGTGYQEHRELKNYAFFKSAMLSVDLKGFQILYYP